jgi:hypothetical protein
MVIKRRFNYLMLLFASVNEHKIEAGVITTSARKHNCVNLLFEVIAEDKL